MGILPSRTVLSLKHWGFAGQAFSAQAAYPKGPPGEHSVRGWGRSRPSAGQAPGHYAPREQMTPSHLQWVLLAAAGPGVWLGQPVWVSCPGRGDWHLAQPVSQVLGCVECGHQLSQQARGLSRTQASPPGPETTIPSPQRVPGCCVSREPLGQVPLPEPHPVLCGTTDSTILV